MTTNNAAFVGSIPENYDRYLGPPMFDPYAADLVARLDVPENAAVLEIACGTGIVTRRLRDKFAPSTKIIATDLNQAMIDHAKQKFRAEENVEWKTADATELPFADASVDAVVCQFGDNPPDFYDIPFSYYDRDTLRSLLTSAGFKEVNVSEVPLAEVADSAE